MERKEEPRISVGLDGIVNQTGSILETAVGIKTVEGSIRFNLSHSSSIDKLSVFFVALEVDLSKFFLITRFLHSISHFLFFNLFNKILC